MRSTQRFLLCILVPVLAFAHGDDDHGAAPAPRAALSGQPRFETATESFELVGHLRDGELSLLIDRYDTNEPVLDGNVEAELNGRKAIARFDADHGDYAIDDAAFIRSLSVPGQHALTITVADGGDMDLLAATMDVAGDGHAPPAGAASRISLPAAAVAGVVITIVLAAVAIALARRRTATGNRS